MRVSGGGARARENAGAGGKGLRLFFFAAMDVRISRSLLSTYWTLALILTGISAPLLGKLYAAVGARIMIGVAGLRRDDFCSHLSRAAPFLFAAGLFFGI